MQPVNATLVPKYRVMWDWERDKFKEVTRPRLPGVFRCGELSNNLNGHYVNLTRDWQFFWFDLCSKIYYGRLHQDLTPDEYHWLANRWTSLGATAIAFTNQHGLDKFRNYVLEERMSKEEPKIYTLVCGGASLTGTPVLYQKGKMCRWMLKVAHFNGRQAPPPVETIDPYTDPRVFFATTIVNKKIRREYQVTVFEANKEKLTQKTKQFKNGYQANPFPQLAREGGGLADCPVPLLAYEDIYYPMEDLVLIEDGVKPSPYFLPT